MAIHGTWLAKDQGVSAKSVFLQISSFLKKRFSLFQNLSLGQKLALGQNYGHGNAGTVLLIQPIRGFDGFSRADFLQPPISLNDDLLSI